MTAETGPSAGITAASGRSAATAAIADATSGRRATSARKVRVAAATVSGSRAATSRGNAIAVIGAITAINPGISSAARDRRSASVMANNGQASRVRNARASHAKRNNVRPSSAKPNHARGSSANPNHVKANAPSRSRACSR